MDLISVIVPIFNMEKYLKRCLDSLESQTYSNLEVILINDGSTDKSEEIAKKYTNRNDNFFLYSKKNGGLSSARNYGLEMVKGKYVGFVDSDDWIHPEMYEILHNCCTFEQCKMAQINYEFVGNYNDSLNSRQKSYVGSSERGKLVNGRSLCIQQYLQDGMLPHKSYPVWSKLYETRLFDSVKFPENQLYEDVVTNYRIISMLDSYVICDFPLYYYFISKDSITRSKLKVKDTDYIHVGNELVSLSRNENSQIVKMAEMTLARTYFMCLGKGLKYGCEKDVSLNKLLEKGISCIRHNLLQLLGSKMSFSRKILLVGLIINKRITKLLINRRVN